MSKELITMEALNIAQTTEFKDKRLAEATAKIVKLYESTATFVEKKNREFASILSTVKTEKSYEADGYKSVADYAEKVFGLSRSNAYALATAGDVYNDVNAPDEVKALSPSKLAELANVPKDKLAADIKAGTISATTTQKDLREYAKTAAPNAEEKPVVLPQYTARMVWGGVYDEEEKEKFETPRILEDWHEIITQDIINNHECTRAPEVIKLPKCQPYFAPIQEKKPIIRYLYITEVCAYAFEFYEKTPEKPKKEKVSAPKYTREELLRMLAEMDETPEEAKPASQRGKDKDDQ